MERIPPPPRDQHDLEFFFVPQHTLAGNTDANTEWDICLENLSIGGHHQALHIVMTC